MEAAMLTRFEQSELPEAASSSASMQAVELDHEDVGELGQEESLEIDPHSNLKLLPAGTRVRVVENRRNQKGRAAHFLGESGVVTGTAPQGMGGWHIIEVGGEHLKLQRNSLVVLSLPLEGEAGAGLDYRMNERLKQPPANSGAPGTEASKKYRQKRVPQDSDTDEPAKRPRRTNAARVDIFHEQEASAFVRRLGVASVKKYAKQHGIQLPPSDLKEAADRCWRHFQKQKDFSHDQVEGLLYKVGQVLKKGQCRSR